MLNGNEKKYVNECLSSTWISSKGEFILRFEESFARYINVEHATTVSNGTVALHLALLAIGIGPEDEVIVPTFTYIASVNSIVHVGAKPVFIDSLSSTWQMDPLDIERKITSRTKAVMAVHLYGHPCDMAAISRLCKKYNLLLIEDCAEAFGSYYEGSHVGTFGDIATFSFFGNKTITTGEGGMVVTKQLKYYEMALRLKTQGVSSHTQYWHDIIGYNYRMTNICAAIGLAQLENADELIAKKRLIASWYQEFLTDLPLTVHQETENVIHSYWMCSILLNTPEEREPLRTHLLKEGVETRPLFYPVHQMPMYANQESYPIATHISERGMNLPSYPSLTKHDVEQISKIIRSFFRC